MATKITDLFFKGVSYWKNVFVFHGFLSLYWIFRSPTVGFVDFPRSQISDPVSFPDDTDRFWGWWYIPNCQMLNKLPRSSSFVVSILHFQGYCISYPNWPGSMVTLKLFTLFQLVKRDVFTSLVLRQSPSLDTLKFILSLHPLLLTLYHHMSTHENQWYYFSAFGSDHFLFGCIYPPPTSHHQNNMSF